MARSKFHTQDPQILGPNVWNVEAMASWCPRYLHPLILNVSMLSVHLFWTKTNCIRIVKFCWDNDTRTYHCANCHSLQSAGQEVPVRISVTVWDRKLLNFQGCHTSGNEGLELTISESLLKFYFYIPRIVLFDAWNSDRWILTFQWKLLPLYSGQKSHSLRLHFLHLSLSFISLRSVLH